MIRPSLRLTLRSALALVLAVCICALSASGQEPAPQQSTTGPIPPPSVEPVKARQFEGGGISGAISGVPPYMWRHGCGPTAVGMVLGYYDTHGFPALYAGDGATQTGNVSQGIASQGSGTKGSGSQLHYEDYALPMDSSPSPALADCSATYPTGCHVSNSIADFMHTSWSSDANLYGWSWSNMVIPSFTSYATLKSLYYQPQAASYYMGSSLTWSVLTNEIDHNRPMVFLVDSDGNGNTDHFVTVVAYSDSPTQQYGCLDTWYSPIRWSNFLPMSSSYSWGVWGGWSFNLSAKPCPIDFEGESKSNITVFRPDTGTWYSLSNATAGSYISTRWGTVGDLSVQDDYDGDRKSDIAVWRPGTGTWYILPSSNPGAYTSTQWGLLGDKPVPADYDGDGKSDIAVWRPSTGTWYVLPSGSSGSYTSTQWGMNGDISVPSDYNGDSKSDIAVWRPSTGTWYVLPSGSGSYTSTQWGMNGDIPVPGDYSGDSKSDIAVWRPGTGTWYVLSSSSPGTYKVTPWGMSTDTPVTGDFDGDRIIDIAVWRSGNGVWYVMPSGSPGTYSGTQWGTSTDMPISLSTRILGSLP
jgi:hypothetical protein